MKDYLFLRFFDNSENVIPTDSIKLGHKSMVNTNRPLDADVFAYVTNWMIHNPNGKVDFRWATVNGIM